MTLFAIALVPGGNILRSIHTLKTLAWRKGDSGAGMGFPEAVYLGFYHIGTASIPGMVRGFRTSARKLFPLIPPEFDFSSIKKLSSGWYLVTGRELPRDLLEAADQVAHEMGLTNSSLAPMERGAGFFICADVTPEAFEAFSFRHLDVQLLRIDADDDSFAFMEWMCLGGVRRPTGPKKRIPPPET